MEIITQKEAKNKGLAYFYTGKPCKFGHLAMRLTVSYRCTTCSQEYMTTWRKENATHLATYQKRWVSEHPENVKKNNRAAYRKNYKAHMLRRAKRAAHLNNIPFDLTMNDIVVPTVCPVFGVPFSFGDGIQVDSSATLDRIVPKKGYVRGNVIIVSAKANRIKNDATVDDIQRVADFYRALTS